MDLDTLESNFNESSDDSLENTKENSQHLSDVIVTQIILCIAIITGLFILNIFKPEVSTYIVTEFKRHSSADFSDTIKTVLAWIYDRI